MGVHVSKKTPRIESVIVTDYNGHVRIEQVDLDRLYKLEFREAEYLRTITELRNELSDTKKACLNLSETNEALSREVSKLRWALIDAENKIEELQRIEVEVKVE